MRPWPGYWAVGAEEETAMNGVWKKGPAGDLFEALEQARPWSPVSDVLSPGTEACVGSCPACCQAGYLLVNGADAQRLGSMAITF